jgi:hypothetical protein
MSDLFELEPPIDERAETESGPAHLRAPEPVSQLATHWFAARAEFIAAGSDARGNRDQAAELLALGAMRTVYWLAVANVELALAREIAEWWAECAPLHGQGEIIK